MNKKCCILGVLVILIILSGCSDVKVKDLQATPKEVIIENEPPSYESIRNRVSIQSFDFSREYNPPRKVTLNVGEVISLQNGLKAELEAASSNRLIIILFYEKNGKKVYFPKPFRFLPRVADNFGNGPFVSVAGGYIYFSDYNDFSDYNEITGEATVEIFDSCIDLYQMCLEDNSNVENEFCEKNACLYEPFREGIYRMNLGKFSVIYRQGGETAALNIMKYLPNCYEAIENIFGQEQDIIRFYVNLQEGTSGIAHAGADRIVLTWQDYMEDQFTLENLEDACGVRFFPLGHEMVHVHDFGTWNTPILREGFANYVSRRVATFDQDLTCENEGYHRRDPITGEDEPLQAYPKNKEEFDNLAYVAGECYFQLLEKRFGVSKVNEIIRQLGETRNLETNGEVNFFIDVVDPILGRDAIELAESMGIDTTCTYEVPFKGYNCAGD